MIKFDTMKISKRDYNNAIKLVTEYHKQQAAILNKKRNTGYYSVLYLLDKDGEEDFRERLIKASTPQKAIQKFMKRAPISLRWLDEDLEMNGKSYYIGDEPSVLNYL